MVYRWASQVIPTLLPFQGPICSRVGQGLNYLKYSTFFYRALPNIWCPTQVLIFCGAPSGALLLLINFMPDMQVSSIC